MAGHYHNPFNENGRGDTWSRHALSEIGIDEIYSFYADEPREPRRIIAYLGDTNTGKTWQAMQLLAAAPNGAYLAPLRLLALEGRDTLEEMGVPCDLITGEERQTTAGSRHVSSTTEMHSIDREFDTIVIDEVQLLMDEARGWAWTRALVASNASTIILTGSADAEKIISKIARLTGDELEIHHFKRQVQLELEEEPFNLKDLRPGDAIIAFSRNHVLDWKEIVRRRLKDVSVIYGALSPDVRRIEANRFRNRETSVIVATDAIGMGLNLPIDRVIFTTLSKYDGKTKRTLLPAEIRQIAGRAGRGIDKVGKVAVMTNNRDVALIRRAINPPKNQHVNLAVRVAPEWHSIERLMDLQPFHTFSEILQLFDRVINARKGIAYDIDRATYDMLSMLEAKNYTAYDQYRHIGLPLNVNTPDDRKRFSQWTHDIKMGATAKCPEVKPASAETVFDKTYLDFQEILNRHLTAYSWLARKFPDRYAQGDQAMERRAIVTENIAQTLMQGRMIRQCKQCPAILKPLAPSGICRTCEDRFHGRS